MARGLTHIRRGTASTLKKVNNTRSQVLGNFILKREKRSDSSGGAENKSSLEMSYVKTIRFIKKFKMLH